METFLKIIGWIAVIWLGGSFLYSTKFHLGNYLSIKAKKESGESGEVYEEIAKRRFSWKTVIFFQVIKLVIIVALLYFLL